MKADLNLVKGVRQLPRYRKDAHSDSCAIRSYTRRQSTFQTTLDKFFTDIKHFNSVSNVLYYTILMFYYFFPVYIYNWHRRIVRVLTIFSKTVEQCHFSHWLLRQFLHSFNLYGHYFWSHTIIQSEDLPILSYWQQWLLRDLLFTELQRLSNEKFQINLIALKCYLGTFFRNKLLCEICLLGTVQHSLHF